jgi:hypothetical protein
MSRRFAVGQKAVVLVLTKREAAAIAGAVTNFYMVAGYDTKTISGKLVSALEQIGEDPSKYGLVRQ